MVSGWFSSNIPEYNTTNTPTPVARNTVSDWFSSNIGADNTTKTPTPDAA